MKPAAGFLAENRWLLAALAQVPLLAILIVVIGGRHVSEVTPANWKSVGQGIAATTFALAIAAVWLGCSVAVAAVAGGQWPLRRDEVDSDRFLIFVGSRLAVFASACALGCVLLLAIVYWGTGLKGPWLPMSAHAGDGVARGTVLGLLISAAVGSWQAVAAALIGCLC